MEGFMKGSTNHCYIQNIEALDLAVSQIFFVCVSPIVSLWALSVAMETTILIQFAPNHNAVNSSTQ